MRVEDLAQRYQDTFIDYKGQPSYVREFGMGVGGEKTFIKYTQYSPTGAVLNDATYEPFEADALNTARPRSGWYVLPEEKVCFLSYPMKRQWKRGLCERNTNIQQVKGARLGVCSLFGGILSYPDVVDQKITKEILEGNKTVILRPDRVLIRHDEGEFSFWVRQKKVAKFILEDAEIRLYEPDFFQELQEVCQGPLLKFFSIKREKLDKPPAGKLYKANKVLDDIMRRQAPEGVEIDFVRNEVAPPPARQEMRTLPDFLHDNLVRVDKVLRGVIPFFVQGISLNLQAIPRSNALLLVSTAHGLGRDRSEHVRAASMRSCTISVGNKLVTAWLARNRNEEHDVTCLLEYV